jgi:hypothetical protein
MTTKCLYCVSISCTSISISYSSVLHSTGTRIEYRFFGILFYVKKFHNHYYMEEDGILNTEIVESFKTVLT